MPRDEPGYSQTHARDFQKFCHDLPEDAGWVCYEAVLPRVDGHVRAWLKGSSLESLDPADDQIARLAGAFANDQRVGLMRALHGGQSTFSALRERTGMTAGRLQHHLRELALAGFLRDTRRRNHYELSTLGTALLQVMLCLGQWPPTEDGEAMLAPDQV